MSGILSAFDLGNPVFKGFIFYNSILAVKMMAMPILTGRQRFKNKVMAMAILTGRQRMKNKAFANPEDAANLKAKPRVDENVERVRRAHLNDLENIPIFYFVSFGYLFTNPAAGTALLLFRVFTIARFIHTLVYAVVVVPQPARALAWFTGYAITGYMAVQTILHFW